MKRCCKYEKYPNFAPVNRKGQIVVKKSIAAILLTVLLFVYAEKAIHHHDCSPAEKTGKAISHNKNYTTCTLCDFQPVKAADLPFIIESSVPVKFILSFYFTEKENYYFRPFVFINGRGPPIEC